MKAFANFPCRWLRNPRSSSREEYAGGKENIISHRAFLAAKKEISSWPDYAVTPLVDFKGIARGVHVRTVWYKDEGERFNLGSFKALGGAFAVYRMLVRQIERQLGIAVVSAAAVASSRFQELVSSITVTCATDGNHGRSVAWGAEKFGCRCVIYVHSGVSEERIDAIARYGARIVRTAGNYDDAVRKAAEDAQREGWHVVSDTSYEGYTDIPRDVMQGYTVMVDEAVSQLGDERPTHVFVQGGVGGLAAAVCGHLWELWGKGRPRVVVVEPEIANCLYESAAHGKLTTVSGSLNTIMAGLACGEVSLLAWEILHSGADYFMTIPDEAAMECMRLLASGLDGDPRVVAGESGVAGLAGFLIAAQSVALRHALELDASSRILCFGTEADTDSALYQRIVGKTGDQVRRAQGHAAASFS